MKGLGYIKGEGLEKNISKRGPEQKGVDQFIRGGCDLG